MKGEEDSDAQLPAGTVRFISYERATSDIIAIFKTACGGTEGVGDRLSGEQNSITCRRTSVDEVNK